MYIYVYILRIYNVFPSRERIEAILTNSIFLGVQIQWRVHNLGRSSEVFPLIHSSYAAPCPRMMMMMMMIIVIFVVNFVVVVAAAAVVMLNDFDELS